MTLKEESDLKKEIYLKIYSKFIEDLVPCSRCRGDSVIIGGVDRGKMWPGGHKWSYWRRKDLIHTRRLWNSGNRSLGIIFWSQRITEVDF